MRRRQNGKRDREGESYSHCTFEAARLDISAADADLRETRTQKNTTPNSPIQTHRFAHSQLVCSLFPLYRSPVTGRIWTHVNSSISCTSRAHTKTNVSHAVNTDTSHHKKKISTQLPRTQTAKAKTLCFKQMHKAARTLTQLHTKTFLNMLTHSLTGAGHK